MGQFVFFALFIITLIAGLFSYFSPAQQRAMDPMKFMMEGSGLDSVEVTNTKRIQKLDMTTVKGLIQIRKQMDELAQQQKELFNTLVDQQQVMRAASKDLLQLNSLTTEMQDKQRLLIAHGQALLVLNDQLMQNRQLVTDQIDGANINSADTLNTLQQRYLALKSQASDFFDKVNQNDQQVSDQVSKMQDQLHVLANNAQYDNSVQQQTARDRIERMMDKEHEDMKKLVDNENRSKDLLNDAQISLADSKERSNDSLQQTQQLIEEQRQKAQDQQLINQQRIADEKQQMQDAQNR